MTLELDVYAMAAECGDGQHTGLRCPSCHSDDRAMSMLVDGPVIKAVCHRASCGFKFSNQRHPDYMSNHVSRPSRVRPYTGPIEPLDQADLAWFNERFLLPPTICSRLAKSDGRYMLPIFGPEGTRRGWISRRPWEGSPLNERFPRDKGRPHPSEINDPKALTYMDNDEPVQSWVGDRYWSTVVLVEDHISAMRVEYDADKTAIALLGTGINEEKVAEIQRHARHVLIALDSDATGQAFAHARKFGQAFDTCRVVILTQDIKDSNREMVRSLFAGR